MNFACMILNYFILQSYVVYLGGHSHGPEISLNDLDRVTNSHHDLLVSILGSKENAKEAIIYSYKRHINGFAAILEEEDAEKIARHPAVISVFENKGKSLHTTRSWTFMMLEDANGEVSDDSLWTRANFGRDVIIANLDTAKSFNDHGFGPIPSKWKGICQNSSIIQCNKKLIGARYYNKAYLELESNATVTLSPDRFSARDYEGHGTHTLSTAAGNFVTNATILGTPLGTTKGGSPAARVAAYKICWPSKVGGCYEGDILAAFDQAIHDGVDVISLSVGGTANDYLYDGLAIGAFHAIQNNAVVVASGGNSGPDPWTVSNVAPWFITVAASTIDRTFQSNVHLQNGIILKGESFSTTKTEKKFYPLIYAANAGNANSSVKDAELCSPGSLDPEKVKGKIIVCLRGESARVAKGVVAAQAGAVGMILCNNAAAGNGINADPHFLPATHITYHDSLPLLSYINSTKEPKAYIQPPEILFDNKPAPQLADFSSRGPNPINPEIIKVELVTT
ncbi:OLC1v1008737C2 [Oldenlandia corymbosa var. corymbosa]|uniref:OLC1v1008737C2 n=1 Tax=Oldenlandia corymbosa var. corymbosa TaxID=529605 RepID=A0AAV1DQI5_OLDCO|nr:OLC1v1008737C2 [Oldenlandia corymbosa var. corymbosa]